MAVRPDDDLPAAEEDPGGGLGGDPTVWAPEEPCIRKKKKKTNKYIFFGEDFQNIRKEAKR